MTTREQELMTAIERIITAINARDFDAVERDGSFHPEFSWESAVTAVEGGHYEGGPSVWRRWARDVDAVWADFHVELRGVRALDDGRFLATYRATGIARASEIPLDAELAIVWTMRDGLFWHGKADLHPGGTAP